MMKGSRARVVVQFDSPEEAEIICRALSIEKASSERDRTEADLKVEDGKFCLDIRACDLPSFRAALNSYSRWIGVSSGLIGEYGTTRRQ